MLMLNRDLALFIGRSPSMISQNLLPITISRCALKRAWLVAPFVTCWGYQHSIMPPSKKKYSQNPPTRVATYKAAGIMGVPSMDTFFNHDDNQTIDSLEATDTFLKGNLNSSTRSGSAGGNGDDGDSS
jgi:hypothetical protein